VRAKGLGCNRPYSAFLRCQDPGLLDQFGKIDSPPPRPWASRARRDHIPGLEESLGATILREDRERSPVDVKSTAHLTLKRRSVERSRQLATLTPLPSQANRADDARRLIHDSLDRLLMLIRALYDVHRPGSRYFSCSLQMLPVKGKVCAAALLVPDTRDSASAGATRPDREPSRGRRRHRQRGRTSVSTGRLRHPRDNAREVQCRAIPR
jgi:hypothetical protein